MKANADYTLYLVTDRALMTASTLEDCVERAILGGCTMVQIREKRVPSREFFDAALAVRAVTSRLGVPLIVNDRADIALAVDADGVHVGQDDLPAETARRIVGPDKIVGVSVGTLEEAIAARDAGADYIGVGAMYATGTKTDAEIVGIDELLRIRAAIELPVVAIGGINARTATNLNGTGIDGIAVISGIVAQPDITSAARTLRTVFRPGVRNIA